LSEVIVGPTGDNTYDVRGWWSNSWGNAYSHYYTPNSTASDVIWSVVPTMCNTGGAGLNAPCSATGPCWSAIIIGARSRHPGGLNACYVDGSVRFVQNAISPSIWQALGSINGNEVNVDF
jgi:prepilin-type processing-associated H-X9-DG protein